MRNLMLVLAVLTFMMAGEGTAGAKGNGPAPVVEWGPCPPPPEGFPDTPVECSTLPVPLDYRDPGGRTIDLAILRAATARPDLRRGILLFNPGGPGGPGLDLPRLFALLLPPEVRDQFDLIGFDPRFIGESTPLTCNLDPEQASQAFPPRMQPGGFPETVTFMRGIAQDCARTAGDRLPFVTTANTARDMDEIRRALGEEKLSYLGYSYGTYLGAVYASLFPERTDRIVLDSSVNPFGAWRNVFRGFGHGGEVRFPDFASFAAANDGTYHLGNDRAGIGPLYFRLFDQLEADPIPLEPGVVLDGHLLQAFTFSGLYSDFNFPVLAQVFQALNEGLIGAPAAVRRAMRSLAPLAPPADNFTAAGLGIICGDVAWSRSVDRYRRELTLDKKLFPMFAEVGSNIFACAFWPGQPIEPPVAITPQGPSNILIVQNLRDPATPYLPALGMRIALGQRSRFVSVDQGGHGVYLSSPNRCAHDITTAFLAEGSLPTDDPFCGPELAPPPAVRSMTPAREKALETLRRMIR